MRSRCGQWGWRRRAEHKNGDAEIIKKDHPTHDIRRFVEPGPIVLVSSAYGNETNIMTMGWHMVTEFQPSLVGCIISSASHQWLIR